MRAKSRAGGGKDLVAGFEAGDGLAHRFNLPGKRAPKDRLVRSAEPGGEANAERGPLARGTVPAGDDGRLDAHQDFVVLRDWFGDFGEMNDLRRPVGGVDH